MVLSCHVVVPMPDCVFISQEQDSNPFQSTTFTKILGPHVTCKCYKLGVFKFSLFLFAVVRDHENSSEYNLPLQSFSFGKMHPLG